MADHTRAIANATAFDDAAPVIIGMSANDLCQLDDEQRTASLQAPVHSKFVLQLRVRGRDTVPRCQSSSVQPQLMPSEPLLRTRLDQGGHLQQRDPAQD